MSRLKTLLVDDDRNIRRTLAITLEGLGCEVAAAESAEEAEKLLRADPPELVLTDLKMGGKSGLDLIRIARRATPAPVVVLMTAFASYDNAVEAIKEGAYDYLPKPFTNAQLAQTIEKAKTLVSRRRGSAGGPQGTEFFAGLTSEPMRKLEDFVSRVASTEATILLTGESGTGKSELARQIHARSARAKGPFVVAHCTSLAENLLESELFGHVRGAFTGAVSDHVGKVALANHGTLFLDEIGDLTPRGQAKLLQVLQERVIERVGSNKTTPVDVRVVAATFRDLKSEIKAGRFREDLYFRLNVFEREIPPLRERMQDLPALIELFVREFSAREGLDEATPLPKELLAVMSRYAWPGNVRELRNVIERLVVLSKGRALSMEDLPSQVRSDELQAIPSDRRTLDAVERDHIAKVLASSPNLETAAATLGITTVTLWRKRKLYDLP